MDSVTLLIHACCSCAFTEELLDFAFFDNNIQFMFLRQENADWATLCTNGLSFPPSKTRVLLIESEKKSEHFESGHYERVVSIAGYASVSDFVDNVACDYIHELKVVGLDDYIQYDSARYYSKIFYNCTFVYNV